MKTPKTNKPKIGRSKTSRSQISRSQISRSQTRPSKPDELDSVKTSITRSAAALKYDGINAPTLVAKGQAEVAEKIIAEAKAHNIHIHQDPVLLSVLSQLDLGQEIPRQLYLAVAKIIAFAYFLQGKHPDYSKANTDTADMSEHSSLLEPLALPDAGSSKSQPKKSEKLKGNGQYLTNQQANLLYLNSQKSIE